MIWDRPKGAKALIIAHRGYRARYPENTLAAFDAGLAAGADALEFDVRLTSDGHAVVIHDQTLERTTSGRGAVERCPLATLRRLDAGSWFDRRHAGARVPTLAEVLERFGRVIDLNIEIKTPGADCRPVDADLALEVLRQVHAHRLADRVLISSANRRVLELVAARRRPLEVALVDGAALSAETVDWCRQTGAAAWHPDHRRLTPAAVARMHAAGCRVCAYTVNDASRAAALARIGVDGIFTDEPAGMRAHLAHSV
jgi:glycerophosphoryl diester phosphodiesterase